MVVLLVVPVPHWEGVVDVCRVFVVFSGFLFLLDRGRVFGVGVDIVHDE